MSCQQESKLLQCFFVFSLCFLLALSVTEVDPESPAESEEDWKQKWKKKDIRDYNDADVERLFEQWEEDEDPLPYDELPEWKRNPPKVDLSELDPSNPEKLIQKSKRGRTLMMFATIAGNPTPEQTEQISSLWHSSLFNAQFEIQRYVVGPNRVLFMMNDGAKAWEIKDYLISLENCAEVTVEGKSYPGKASLMAQQKRAEETVKKQQETAESGSNKAPNKKPKSEL